MSSAEAAFNFVFMDGPIKMDWQGIVGEVVREVSARSDSGLKRIQRPEHGRPPEKLYHGTFGWNSAAVSESGIVPAGLGPNWGASDPQYVYLAESPELAANWVREAYAGGDAELDWDRATVSVFEVDAAAIGPVEPDPKGGSADWRHRGAIPPSAVRLVYEADYTDDIPDEADYTDMPENEDAGGDTGSLT